tara:strand:+ start:7280 stop:9229 length:1950 start_codon:yes stop_codon:yes gene_type:complete
MAKSAKKPAPKAAKAAGAAKSTPKAKPAKAHPPTKAQADKPLLFPAEAKARRDALRETIEQHRIGYPTLARDSGVAQRLIRLAVENNGDLSEADWQAVAVACPSVSPLHVMLIGAASVPVAQTGTDTNTGAAPFPSAPAAAGRSHIIRVPLKLLRENPENYRETYDDGAISELAASIKAEGVLQNLVTFPADAKGIYTVNSGNRRFRALKLLEKRRDIDDSYLVHIYPKQMTQDEALALAIVENLQRQDVDALEEAEGFARLVKMGWSTEKISNSVGIAQRTVQDRLQLATGLFADARRALQTKKITIDQARAIVTAPTVTLQKELIERANLYGKPQPAEDLRKWLKSTLPPVSVAGFELELYKGAFVGEGKSRLFADVDAFDKLQREAAKAQVKALRPSFDKVTLLKAGDYFASWKYSAAPKGTAGEAVVEVDSHSRKIVVHKGLVAKDAGRAAKKDDAPEDEAEREAFEAAREKARAARDEALQSFAQSLSMCWNTRPTHLMRLTLFGALVDYHVDIDCDFPHVEPSDDDLTVLLAALELSDMRPADVKHFSGVDDSDDLEKVWTTLLALPDAEITNLFVGLCVRGTAQRYSQQRSIAVLDCTLLTSMGVGIPAVLLPAEAESATDDDDASDAGDDVAEDADEMEVA